MDSHRRSPRLLLVDDDPLVLKALTRVLAPEGYQIHAFSRPLDALSHLENQPVDVIVSDLCMPQMDGREFLRRASLISPNSMRITLSGYVEEESALAGDGPVSWRILSKPWCNRELKQTVADALVFPLSRPLSAVV